MDRVEIIALLGSLSLLALVLELVRRRKLSEAYSLLWLMTAVILVILSLWRGLLDVLANLLGIFYPPTALFIVGFGFVLLILLQFSVLASRLSEENRRVIQRLAILDWRLRKLEERDREEPDEEPQQEDPGEES